MLHLSLVYIWLDTLPVTLTDGVWFTSLVQDAGNALGVLRVVGVPVMQEHHTLVEACSPSTALNSAERV